MFGIGTGELLLLLVLALLVLGPERMPKLARDIGKTVSDLRKTSDELRAEFLNADQMLKQPERLLDVAARHAGEGGTTVASASQAADAGTTSATAEGLPGGAGVPPGSTETMPATDAQGPVPPDAGATQAEAMTDVPPIPAEPEETEFDREARLARERIEDPERMKEHMERAKAEGWTVPTDDAGTSAREG